MKRLSFYLTCSFLVAAQACGGGDSGADAELDADTALLAEEMTGDHPSCERPHRDLSEADTDGDGALSREEREAFRAARREAILAEFDVDGDGELSAEERQAARDAKRAERFAELDTDGDERLSADEVADNCRLAHRFASLDVDEDGFISLEEFSAARWGRFGRGFGPKR